ncbi:MAG: lipid-A-disaccharide synthase [Woeseiaceae bacterium]
MKVGLVAGEASGDLLGAGLIKALKAQYPQAIFEGVAGSAMVAAGCDRWADAESLAVMGLVEPLREIPRLFRLRRSLINRWRTSPPDVFVGIDAPDFNLGLETALRKSGIPTVHYVSPSVWAWRPGRIEKVRKAADCVLCILPFEKKLYDERGVPAEFVGHPKADSLSADIDAVTIRRSLALRDSGPLVAVLPGSRDSEVSRLGPIFAATAAKLARARPDLRFVLPIASLKLSPSIRAHLRDAGIADRFTLLDGTSEQAMAAADVVLLASGTAALEAALLGKPMVAAYRVAAMSFAIFKLFRLVKLRYFTLPNLLTQTPLVPEFIQDDATVDALADAVGSLLDDPQRCADIRRRFATLRSELALGADQRAADAVIRLATKKPGSNQRIS